MISNRMLCPVLVTAFAFLLAGTGQGFAQSPPPTCGTTTWNLTAGQTTDVGSVEVCNDLNNIYVKYTLDYPGATFGTLHMWVGNNLANVPANPQGTPVPGQFCSALGGACYDATGLTTYTFTIPFSSLNIVDANAMCGSALYVVTHAEVNIDTNGDGTAEQHETAFGGPTPGSGPRWWFYGQYTICCAFGQPPAPRYETAYAKGGYVWTTDRKSNPEGLPSLSLTKNQWGWAINLLPADIGIPKIYDIWAGAGLNNITTNTEAVKVGTLTVNWNGTTVTATYNMFAGNLLQEVHLYARDAAPTTTAPGQYGYLDSFEPAGASSYTFTVPLADTNGTGGVWLIAHAVVSLP